MCFGLWLKYEKLDDNQSYKRTPILSLYLWLDPQAQKKKLKYSCTPMDWERGIKGGILGDLWARFRLLICSFQTRACWYIWGDTIKKISKNQNMYPHCFGCSQNFPKVPKWCFWRFWVIVGESQNGGDTFSDFLIFFSPWLYLLITTSSSLKAAD